MHLMLQQHFAQVQISENHLQCQQSGPLAQRIRGMSVHCPSAISV